MLVIEVVLLPF